MDQHQQNLARQYFLQDSRGNVGDNLMFWALGGGYTSDLAKAVRFTEEKAFAQNASRPTDVPWPIDYIKERTHCVVDMQYLDNAEAREYRNSVEFYLQALPVSYVGNDVKFVTTDGGTATDLSQARVFSHAELFDGGAQRVRGQVWPKAYIEIKSRWAADCRKVRLADALKDVPRVLVQEPKPAKKRYRCHSCGVFMSEVDYYASGCGKCGAYNRP